VQEFTLKQLSQNIQRGQSFDAGTLYLLLDFVPCILHMENRVGLTIMRLLIQEGLDHCHKMPRFLARFGHNHHLAMRKAYIDEVELYVNTKVMGSEERHTQWECTIEDKNNYKKVGAICLDNNRTRLVVQSLVRRKEDFSNQDILDFQDHIDQWFQLWVKLHGKDGVTNYVHMLASGHVAEYLNYWKSLYSHSQQGKPMTSNCTTVKNANH
jgi:hypothetical protein